MNDMINDMAAQTMAALDLSDEEWDAIPESAQAKIMSAMETREELLRALSALLFVVMFVVNEDGDYFIRQEAQKHIAAARAAIAKADPWRED